MNQYQLVFILDEEDNKKLTDIAQIIVNHSGNVTAKNFVEKRTLAYPIKKKKIGYYYKWEFTSESNQLKKITQKFNLENIMLRYLILIKE